MTEQAFVFEQLEARGELLTASTTPADRAAEIVAAAQARGAEIEAEARAKGFGTGLAEGRVAAEQELATTRTALEGVLAALQDAREAYVAAAEREVIELALAVAEKVLSASLAADPELVCNVVAGALRRVATGGGLVVELNPEDVELVRAWLAAGGSPASVAIELRAERRIPRGGCVVRTAEGEIDARIREQLDLAEEILRETFGSSAR